jgi:rifampin ADP-ribosylating transferase
MDMEGTGNPKKQAEYFFSLEGSDKRLEKFTAAYYVARHQKNVHDKLVWLETSLQFALRINDVTVKGAFPSLYSNIAKCYET